MAQNSTQPTWDAAALATQLGKIAEQSQRLVQDFLLDRPDIAQLGMGDVTTLPGAFIELTTKMMTDPAAIARTQIDLFNDSLRVWQTTAERLMGHGAGNEEPPQDKRFKHPDWTESVVFNFVKESYLIWAKAVLAAVHGVEGLDPATARKVDFYTRQFVDALSPSNFVATNPEVLAATLETGGQNLLRGLENLLEDLQRGKGRLSITMTDMGAFRLGDNIAATPGKVVFQNDLMQLIQYTPATPDVRRRPLLIVPPWINKFYVLDLQPKNSFIKWAVDQGHTVFVISWVNPDERLAEKSFDGLHAGGSARSPRRDRDGDGRTFSQRRWLLPGRHVARLDPRLYDRARRRADRQRQLFRHARRLHGCWRHGGVHRRRAARFAR